jgi:hypothetical protein
LQSEGVGDEIGEVHPWFASKKFSFKEIVKMNFEFENTQRIVWDVEDRVEFFQDMLELLNIDDDDAAEIIEELQSRDFDYLEIAAYLPGRQSEDPAAALVFDGKKDVYWDVFNPKDFRRIQAQVQKLANNKAKLAYTRGLTQRDWRKRLKALGGF